MIEEERKKGHENLQDLFSYFVDEFNQITPKHVSTTYYDCLNTQSHLKWKTLAVFCLELHWYQTALIQVDFLAKITGM